MINHLQRYAPTLFSVTRIVFGLFFMMHGLVIFHWIHPPAAVGAVALRHSAASSEAAGGGLHLIAGFLDVLGGGLVVCGLFTRVVAFVLSGEMAWAYFMVHAPQNIWPIFNNGDAAVLYCWFFFLVVFVGPGPLSLDRILFSREGMEENRAPYGLSE